MNFNNLLVIVRDGVATLSVNRPDKLNALNDDVVSQLHQAAQLLKNDDMVRGVIVTSRAVTQGYDFVSRFFAPGSGIPEDPVTGSAHCALGPYWSERLGKTEFVAYQASARGGVVRVRVVGDRVKLGGQAVTVLRGTLV